MYNLVLADKNYNLVATNAENGIIINPVMLDDGLLSLTNLHNNEDNVINVFDIEFKLGVKKADKLDYLAATFSGALAYAIHHFVTGKNKLNIDLDNLKLEDVVTLSSGLLKYYNFSENKIKEAEKEINDAIDVCADKIQKATKYKELAIDFARGLSYKALLMSIFTSVLEIEIGKDDKGKLIINKIEDKELIGKTTFKKVKIGFVRWLIATTVEYRNTGKFDEEINDVLKVKGGLKKLKEIVEELAETKFFKEKDFDESKLSKYFISEINKTKETDEEQKLNIGAILEKQAIPVMFNKAFVRSYYFIKTFINQVNEHGTRTLEGLEVLELAKAYKRDARVVARIDTVSTTVFMAFDVIPSAAAGIKAGYNIFKTSYVPSEDEKVALVNAIIAGVKAAKEGASVFASTVNFANIGEFITVINVDKNYLIEDVKNIFNKTKLVEVKKSQFTKLTDEQISSVLGLNTTETKILYSLELDVVNTDIQNTKKSEIQTRKNSWKKQWASECEKALNMKKLFQEDREKLYSTIKTYRENNNDLWLYKLLIELMSFKPYCQLDDDNKKYKGLNLAKENYIEDIFCKEQKMCEYKECSKLNNTYKKYSGTLSGSTLKTTAMIASAAILTVGTAGAAFAFAPAIAVGLVGGSFAGLSGAALTSASLALVGGGAVAAGGFGMAGGAVVIAGGGALLGLGTSGATAAAFAMMSTSNFVLDDYSKLITKCDILLNKYDMKNEVLNIQNQLILELDSAKVRLDVLKNTIEINKENKKERNALIKEQEKSINIMEKANSSLYKLIEKYNKG